MKSRILVVEDNLVAYKVGQRFFNIIGCETDHAMTGEDAIEMFIQRVETQKPYVAIYMDLILPKMSGIETCHAIRQYEKMKNRMPVPIIAVTGSQDPNIVSDCLEAGMASVLPKPMTRNSLLDFERSIAMYHLRELQ